MTTSEPAQTETTLAVIARFNAALERHDIDGMLAEMTEDTVFENTSPAPDGERYEGATALRAFFARFFAVNPRARFDIEEQYAAGERCVVRWRYDWGDGHVRGVDLIRLRAGRIAETLSYVKG
jgi:ketosteroid isomerase-like protein